MSDSHGTLAITSFPPELRAEIFACALTFPGILSRHTKTDVRPSLASELALLLASKAVYDEAAAAFYAHNTFRFALPTRAALAAAANDPSDDRSPSSDRACEAALPVPRAHIGRLRHVVFHKSLAGHWPNGPLTNAALGREGLGERELARMLAFIGAHNGVLASVGVVLQREAEVNVIQWDEDPIALLRELDRGRRFARVVESLPELRRLEVWKARRCDTRWMMFPEGNLEKGEVHVEVVREGKLGEVREAHFANVVRARYERRAWGEYLVAPDKDAELFMKEGFVLDFAYQGRRRSA